MQKVRTASTRDRRAVAVRRSELHSDMGEPVTAIVAASLTAASQVLPSVLGGKSKAEKLAEQQRKRLKAKRGARRLRQQIENDRSRIARKAASWTLNEARKIQRGGAEEMYEQALSDYFATAKESGVAGAQQLAETAATNLRQWAIAKAQEREDWLILKRNSPQIAGAAFVVAGGGLLAWRAINSNE